jgi:ectoine hydroxylase-related dioxygenase (phytanoyl-CoA dioxygenase family)
MSYNHLVEEFQNNGFVVLDDVFSAAEIAAVSNDVDRVIKARLLTCRKQKLCTNRTLAATCPQCIPAPCLRQAVSGNSKTTPN